MGAYFQSLEALKGNSQRVLFLDAGGKSRQEQTGAGKKGVPDAV